MAAHAKAKAKVRSFFASSALWTIFDMVSMTVDTGAMLDEARKFKSLVWLIDREQHMALSIHFARPAHN